MNLKSLRAKVKYYTNPKFLRAKIVFFIILNVINIHH